MSNQHKKNKLINQNPQIKKILNNEVNLNIIK